MRFLFTCGGTAGHINPAIGVAGRLKALLPQAEILFVGAAGRMETELVPREGYEIRTVEISSLSRSLNLNGLKHNVSTVRKVIRSLGEAKEILREFRPDVAIGTGGYVCYPVLRAAHSLGIPTLVHESNAVPGLTTKLLARQVDCVMVGFANVRENYPRGTNVVYTGTPVRDGFRADGADRGALRRRLGLPETQKLVVSVWGSLGSGRINEVFPEFARRTAEEGGFAVIHSAGKRGYEALAAKLDPSWKGRGVDARAYIYDMPTVMAAADLVMCRSGASTLGELAALGKPALLVPSPNVTGNHQEKNARLLERLGAARVLLEPEFDGAGLYQAVRELLEDGPALEAMSRAMASSGVPDAAERIADRVLEYVK